MKINIIKLLNKSAELDFELSQIITVCIEGLSSPPFRKGGTATQYNLRLLQGF